MVLDTNVLLAGLRSNRGASYKLLTILNDSRWQLNISTTLVFEYEEILFRQKAQIGLSDADIDDVIEALIAIANKHRLRYVTFTPNGWREKEFSQPKTGVVCS
ncbi:PIN domain-containing protein [Tolypothrix sp. NIES-4075]|uniref:PIN domain-containing protein n=1 Tax=Tolypothrix sp. NIES-4075 TaxID=2005459 RepID=UPI000B5D050D|nr:PIN domain-containing protein [Tolypothrix sp. NIES-4075]